MGRQSRRKRDRKPHEEGGTLFNVITTIDETDEELVTTARNVVSQSHHRNPMAVMTVHGYDDDPRELWEIPEVAAHMRRLVDFGFIAILMRSFAIPELGGGQFGPNVSAYGAFEVWAHATGKLAGGRIEATADEAKAMIRTFADEVFPAAAESLRKNLRRHADAGPNPDLMLWGKSD